MEACYDIGGLGLRLTGGDDVRRAALLPGMEVFAGTRSSGITVELDAPIEPMRCRLLHSFDILDGTSECRFGIDADGVYHYAFGNDRRRLRYDPREPEVVKCSTLGDLPHLRYALWTAYGMVALHHGAVPVHSSVVVCDGRAVLCLGESGTGKSTHTRLWLENIGGTHLLNDDSPIVRIEGDGVWVYGSPWSGKTHCYLQERYPIAGLLRLEQRPQNSIRRLNTIEAFTALQPSCPPCFARDERYMDALVRYVSGVIERVPVYRMGCLPDAAAAVMSHETIMG